MLEKVIAIIGCGGLGGNIANLIARQNPEKLILYDADVFSKSNLNRQLFSSKDTIGKQKAHVIKENLQNCCNTKIEVVAEFLSWENAHLLKEADLIFDATDNVSSRYLIQEVGHKYNIPILHGAINGMFGQVAIIYPGDKLCQKLYPQKEEQEILPTLSFVPSCIATIQVAEGYNLLSGSPTLKPKEILYIDLEKVVMKRIFI